MGRESSPVMRRSVEEATVFPRGREVALPLRRPSSLMADPRYQLLEKSFGHNRSKSHETSLLTDPSKQRHAEF